MIIEAAGIVISDKHGRVLVLKRKLDVPEGGHLGIPGGKILSGKKPIETALLKTKAETGLTFSENQLSELNKFSYTVDGNQIIFYAFSTSINSVEPEISLNHDGHTDYFWAEPKSLHLRDDLMVGLYPILEFYNSLRQPSQGTQN